MFGRLFAPKSSILPPPPKNQIEVVCPSCGAAQYDPRLVVSTFCKKCGVHLTIQKKRVTASNATRSGAGTEDWTKTDSEPVPPAKQPAEPAPKASIPSRTKSVTRKLDAEAELTPADGFGAYLKAQVETATDSNDSQGELFALEVEPPVVEAPTESQTKEQTLPQPRSQTPTSGLRRATSNSPAPTASPALMNASSLQKMKDQGMYRNQYFKDAECFDCGHKFKTGRSARSANCPSCGASIALEDVEVNMNSTQVVKTRGDVIIRKRGHLSTSSVQCRDLRCFGIVEANMQCSGDAIFKSTGTIIGEVRCKRFIVEKGSEITFMNAVHAEEVEIHARITGNIFSSGLVLIGGNGSVNGDVTARSVSIEPGGELNGAMNIVRPKAAAVPPTAP